MINILFNKDGIGNYDIALKDETKNDDSQSNGFGFKIKEYEVENFKFKYFDESSKIKMVLDSINHSNWRFC